MKFYITRQSGLIGIWWCKATRSITLSLHEHLSFNLGFKFNEKENDEIAEKMGSYLDEKRRLKNLSDEELVNEVAGLPVADSESVLEMMDRLDPEWYDREEPLNNEPMSLSEYLESGR